MIFTGTAEDRHEQQLLAELEDQEPTGWDIHGRPGGDYFSHLGGN